MNLVFIFFFILSLFMVQTNCLRLQANKKTYSGLNRIYSYVSSVDLSVEKSIKPTSQVVQEFFGQYKEKQSFGPDFILSINKIGRSILDSVKLPSMKEEAWRHSNLRALFDFKYGDSSSATRDSITSALVSPYIDEACADSCIVFVDGYFRRDLSRQTNIPSDVLVGSIADHAASAVDLLTRSPDLGELSRNSYGSDVLTALNMVGCDDAAIVIVPANCWLSDPLQVLFVSTTSSTPSISFPSLAVSMGANSSLALKQSYQSTTDPSMWTADEASGVTLNVANTQVSLAKDSCLRHTYVQELGGRARHLEVINADVGEGGRYDVTVLQKGSRISRVNVHVNLTQSQSNCSVTGISLAGTGSSMDLHSSIQHLQRDSHSEQEHRNIVGDRGEAIFKGRIRMPTIAMQSSSSQMCRSLLLGSNARLQAMPVLEIAADDVTCSHGASVADLDENSMFYLGARGISRPVAREMLLGSFALELLQDAVMDKESLVRFTAALTAMSPGAESGEVSGSQGFMSI